MADDRERAREHERERRRLAGDADIGGYDSVGNAFMPENPAPGDLDALYGVAGNGLPLDQLFVGVDADAAEEGISVMNAALALGENPRTVVTDLMNVMNIEQARALTIARTEMLGAWRDAQAINYRANSDVLDGWIWSSSLGGACIACVMMDGTVHPLDEDMDSHPNCACIMVPLTKSWDDLLGDIEGLDLSALDETDYLNQGYEDGQDWFLAQSEATQIEVLGPAKFEAWSSGDVDLLDFVGQRDAGAWGNEIYERSLKEIGLDANTYLGRTTLADVTEATEETATTETASEVVDAHNLGTLDEIQERMAALEGEYAGIPIGDPMTLQAAMTEAEMKPLAAPMEQALARLGSELSADQKYLRMARYMGAMTKDDIGAWETIGYSAEEARIQAMQHSIYGIMEDFHSAAAETGGKFVDNPFQIFVQEAAKTEFKLANTAGYWTNEQITSAMAQWGTYKNGMRDLLRQMYNDTQTWFQERGITEIQVFRGLAWAEGEQPAGMVFNGKAAESALNSLPLSSWSTDASVAYSYATGTGVAETLGGGDYSAVLSGVIPIDQVLSLGFTGFGAPTLREVILLGGDYDMLAVPFVTEGAAMSLSDVLAAMAHDAGE